MDVVARQSGVSMNPVGLIVAALAAGTALGLHGTGGPVVRDAYALLWSRVRRRLASRPDAAMVLSRHAEAPQTWASRLGAELAAAGAAADEDLLAAARAMLELAAAAGYRAEDYPGGAGWPSDLTDIPAPRPGEPAGERPGEPATERAARQAADRTTHPGPG
jgi:hypothetical protein